MTATRRPLVLVLQSTSMARRVAVGAADARAMAEAAVAAGMGRTHVRCFSTSDEAADAFSSYVRAGDLVLVKGSRGIRTDTVVDRLKAEFA